MFGVQLKVRMFFCVNGIDQEISVSERGDNSTKP